MSVRENKFSNFEYIMITTDPIKAAFCCLPILKNLRTSLRLFSPFHVQIEMTDDQFNVAHQATEVSQFKHGLMRSELSTE